MNTNEFSGFRPISSTPKEDPKNQIIGILTPSQLEVPTLSSDYITQIAEREGLHSCLPTSLLNGLIHLGAITSEEALQFQESFRDKNSDMFSQRQFGERTLTVLAVPTGLVLERLKAETGKNFTYQVIGVKDLNEGEVEQLLHEKLSQGKVIVGGDQNHAVLIVGYNKEGNTFAIRDPYSPRQESQERASDFIKAILSGEPWITVLEIKQD